MKKNNKKTYEIIILMCYNNCTMCNKCVNPVDMDLHIFSLVAIQYERFLQAIRKNTIFN